MWSSIRPLFLGFSTALAVFIFFGYLLYIDVVEFDHAFKLALGLSFGAMMWFTRKRDG